MSVKRYRLALPASTERIRQARATLKKMSQEEQIDLMVNAGVMTVQQVEQAKMKLGEAGFIE
jgi:hypothetical protein